MTTVSLTRLRDAAHATKTLALRSLATIGLTQSESRIAADAHDYWTAAGGDRWKSDSHWRDANGFANSDLWDQIGRRHLTIFERGARAVKFTRPWNRVVEWGCGGGANAIHFAPRCAEFIGVDISEESLTECQRQVAAVCDTPFRPVLIPVAEPEQAADAVGGGCDIFLTFYVFELIPTPEYGERILRIAHDLLAPGGLALIQIKYDERGFWTRPRRRSYRAGLAEMTTYPIARFWRLAAECGLRPELVELVPENELDKRYAYFLLSRPAS